MKRERVAIVGSREYPHLGNVRAYLEGLSRTTLIVSGGARGVDKAAECAAKELGMDTLIFPADWKRYGARAGYLRNAQIVDSCDRLVAFWDGKSAGTLHSINLAKAAKKPVHIFDE